MNIVVLAGGLSTERDVSLVTGSMVSEALRKNGHKALLLDVFLGYEGKETVEELFANDEKYSVHTDTVPQSEPDLEAVKAKRKDQTDCAFGSRVLEICKKADIVFMALHGGIGENGKIQAAFDLFGIRYTGCGYLESALAMDKGLTKTMFLTAGIPTPRGITMRQGEYAKAFHYTGLDLPCVVKPCCGGSSIGVSIVYTIDEFDQALETAFQYEEEVVIEQYIEGRDFSVGILDGMVLPVIEIEPVEGFYDYKNKYKAGNAVETCPADLKDNITKEMQCYTKEAASVLGLKSYARMDFVMDAEENVYCLEANTLPGMTPLSLLPQEAQAVGIDFGQLCEKILETALKKYQ